MASISKRGNSYRISVSHGRRPDGTQIIHTMTYKPTSTAPTKVKRELTQVIADFEQKVRTGRYLSGEKTSVNDFLEIWKEQYANQKLTARTKSDYISLIENHFLPTIGNMKMTQVNKAVISGIAVSLTKQGKTAGTVHKAVSAMSCVFSFAVSLDVIEINPCRIALPKIKKDKGLHYFTPEETICFLSAIQKPYIDVYKRKNGKTWTQERTMSTQLQAFFHLSLMGGFRLGEQLALTWNDILFDEKKIVINKAVSRLKSGEMIIKEPKTTAGIRTVTVTTSCIDLLKKWRTEQMQLALVMGKDWHGQRDDFDSNHVFIQNDGQMMSLYTPGQAFKRFLERYNSQCKKDSDKLPMIRLHDLRHSSVTFLISEGIDIETVSKRHGHSRPSITWDEYGHCLPEKEDEAARKLQEKFG